MYICFLGEGRRGGGDGRGEGWLLFENGGLRGGVGDGVFLFSLNKLSYLYYYVCMIDGHGGLPFPYK